MAWQVYAVHLGTEGYEVYVKIGCTQSAVETRLAQIAGYRVSPSINHDPFGPALVVVQDSSESTDEYGHPCSGLEQEILGTLNELYLQDREYARGMSGYTEVYRLDYDGLRMMHEAACSGIMSPPARVFVEQLIFKVTETLNGCLDEDAPKFNILDTDDDLQVPDEERETDDGIGHYRSPRTYISWVDEEPEIDESLD